MVKSYLRYAPSEPFGLISTSTSNLVLDSTCKLAICPALNDVVVWNLKQGTLVGRWHDSDNKSQVSFIVRAPKKDIYAVGYFDGSVRMWNLESGTCLFTLNGHKAAVSSLVFDISGTRLLSGSKDTDIILWDLVAETGVYRCDYLLLEYLICDILA